MISQETFEYAVPPGWKPKPLPAKPDPPPGYIHSFSPKHDLENRNYDVCACKDHHLLFDVFQALSQHTNTIWVPLWVLNEEIVVTNRARDQGFKPKSHDPCFYCTVLSGEIMNKEKLKEKLLALCDITVEQLRTGQ